MNIIRHGDILLKEVPEQKVNKIGEEKEYVVAHGESGHRHLMVAEPQTLIEIYQDGKGNQFLRTKGAKLTHEEHETLEVGSGFYQVIHEQEFDPFLESINSVRD